MIIFIITYHFFAIALDLGVLGWTATIFSGLAFVVMFGIASASGDYQGIIDDALKTKSYNEKPKKNKKNDTK
tara:strand:- start:62 stop:277 length:216 start_codon:yes stop_codon:yes gene_type:complete